MEDIIKLTGTNEGRMFILDMIEDIPYELRMDLFNGVSSFYDPALVDFFYLLQMEYGSEYDLPCTRVLEKYKMAGIDVSPPQLLNAAFAGAYASMTRQSGRIAVDVAWATGNQAVQVECFYLTFNADGIHSFFLIEDMNEERYESDRKLLNDMVALSFEEVCFLVSRAYACNIRHMSRPALGKFLYQKYLDQGTLFSMDQQRRLIRRLSIKLTPRQVVNSLFNALKYQDIDYAVAQLAPGVLAEDRSLEDIGFVSPGEVILEGGARDVKGYREHMFVKAYSVTIEDRSLIHSEYNIELGRDEEGIWQITFMEKTSSNKMNINVNPNPLNGEICCHIYEIIDLDQLFDIIDKIDDIREVKELPYGMHMRITRQEDDFNSPVSFLSGVVADLIINGDEFVVMSRDYTVIMDFNEILTGNIDNPVVNYAEYEVNVLTAFRYLGGQYIRFEDILLQEEGDSVFEDGMRFISTRYLTKDRNRVIEQIMAMKNIVYYIRDDFEVYYQWDEEGDDGGFLVEYMLGDNWVTVSTFGERDMNRARNHFQKQMYDCLEFDGIEVRNEGIFDVLTTAVRKEHPELEPFLKDTYLNKWYYSHLTTLHGMSPSEASKTEEGKRLLWTMFKKIKEKEKKRRMYGSPSFIHLKEYMQKVDQKNKENI